MDSDLSFRVNPDNNINDNGTKLLTMCKSFGIRILNGRHEDKMDRDSTFMESRGLSVVDYCLSSPDISGLIEKFRVANFTMYSNPASLHLQILTCPVATEPKGENTAADNTVINSLTPTKSCKWNPECLNEARTALATCYETLMSVTETPKHETQDSIDSSIDLFTTQLTKAMMPLFEVEHSSKPLYRKKNLLKQNTN